MAVKLDQDALNDPVTRHMHTDVARIPADQTVGEALAWVRTHPPPGRIIYFYVVDRDDRLVGVVPTRRLLLSSPERPLAEITISPVVSIPARATVLDACEFFIQYRFLAFPVVDEEKRLLGAVDVELYTDELTQITDGQKPDDLFQLIGVHLTQSQQASSWGAFRTRFPWLICNLAGGILAAFLSGVYEAELARVVALALFIPVVLALAESVSIQSVTLALQMLHSQAPSWGILWRRVRQESFTGAMLGGANGLIVGLVALVWLRDPALAACLLLGIAGGVTLAAIVGIAVPNVLRLFSGDPRIAAGPVSLASADMLTLLLYFNLARWLL